MPQTALTSHGIMAGDGPPATGLSQGTAVSASASSIRQEPEILLTSRSRLQFARRGLQPAVQPQGGFHRRRVALPGGPGLLHQGAEAPLEHGLVEALGPASAVL